jgi:hypothetical protein
MGAPASKRWPDQDRAPHGRSQGGGRRYGASVSAASYPALPGTKLCTVIFDGLLQTHDENTKISFQVLLATSMVVVLSPEQSTRPT